MKNKKAQLPYAMMILVFLPILTLIVGSIAIGSAMFFSDEYDFRKIDAEILNYKVRSCLKDNEFDFSAQDLEEKIYNMCQIKKISQSNDFFITIKINLEQKLHLGVESESSCILSDKNKQFPVCETSSIQKNGDEITITTGSSQNKKEEKI